MTPEQEKKLDGLHDKVDGLHKITVNLTDIITTHISDDAKRFARHEDMLQRVRKWKAEVVEWMRGTRRGREKMTTINPDDSGSIDIGGFGSHLSLKGKWPVRFGLAVLIVLIATASGTLLGRAMTPRIVQSSEAK